MSDVSHPLSDPATSTFAGQLAYPSTYLLTSDTSGGVAVPGLGLVVDNRGIRVLKPDGALAAELPWETVVEFAATARTETPDGGPAVVVEATTATRTHRFAIPTQDPDRIEVEVAHWARQRGTPTADRKISPAMMGVLLSVVALGIVILVLLGLHVI